MSYDLKMKTQSADDSKVAGLLADAFAGSRA